MMQFVFRLLPVATLALFMQTGVQAAAPMQKTQAPGYYRLMVGDDEVTALSDGTVGLPMDKLLSHVPADQIESGFGRDYLKPPIDTSVNAYLINTGTKLILIDTGAGSLFGPTLGKLVRNLEASGYRPDQVDEIYITHMHPDHVGGLVSQGKLVFPNAIVRADQREADQWLDPAHLEAAPADSKGFFQGAMASLQPYVAAGKFKPFSGDTELAPGIRAVSSRGHTDGHTTYRVTSGGQTLLIVGDLIHAAALQFPDPRITIAFDTDASSALAQRLKTFAEVSDKGYWMAAAHLAFPGIGHLRSQGDGYRWIPINYASLVGP